MHPSSSSLRRTSRYQRNAQPIIADKQSGEATFFWRFIAITFLHIVLAILLKQYSPVLPTLYVIILLFVGLSTLRHESPVRLIYVCGYISSAELLWRMTSANVFWEAGKYLVVLLVFLGALRWRVSLIGLGMVYFSLLIPGMLITLQAVSFAIAKDEISFNLSGPLALGAASAFLSGVRLNRHEVGRLLLISIWPIISVGTLTARSTLGTRVSFFALSNFTTSGGYGPNQVSALLGLGVFLGLLYLFVAKPTGLHWWGMLAISIILLAECVLTFSRGGFYNLVFATLVAIFFFTRSGGKEMQRVLLLSVVISLLVSLLLPLLDGYTGGALLTRFESLNTTGRLEIMSTDLRIWQEHPIYGVGVGLAAFNRGSIFHQGNIRVIAHTEYTRLLAEHGLFGAAAILAMVLIFLNGLRRARGGLAKGLVAGLMVWSFLEMAHAAMRIVATSFIFALPLAFLNLDEEKNETTAIGRK